MGKLSIVRLWIIACRDLGRNKRRSILTLLGVALGMAVLIFTIGLDEGTTDGALRNSIRLQTGHMQIRAASNETEKISLAWEDLLDNPQAIIGKVETIKGVRVATPILWASGILSTRDDSIGVRVFGIDPPSEASAPFHEGITAGEFLNPDDRDSILIGERLANSLELGVGDKVSVLISTADEQPDEAAFTIRGLFATGVPSYDETTILLPLSKAQTFTRAGDRASAIFILLNRREDADAIALALQTPGFAIFTWRDLNQVLMQSMAQSGGMMDMMIFIVLAMAAVVIANTLLMAVFERKREIGILGAMGMKKWQILVKFLLEAATLGVAGTVMGILLGGLVVTYLSIVGWNIGEAAASAGAAMAYGTTIYAKFPVNNMISLSVTELFITLLASLYPAWLAARLEPVEAIREL